MQVVLVNPDGGLPPGMEACLADDGWAVSSVADYHQAAELAQEDGVTAVILAPPTPERSSAGADRDYRKLVRAMEARRIAGVVLTDDPRRISLNTDSLVDVAGGQVTKEEIRGRLATIRRYHALVRGMEREVDNLQRIGKRIHEHFKEWDEEMRLAGRLQRDFLPRCVDRVGPVRFAPLYRPAGCVSGDIYDIFRVDERHVGFYVADAVGHGMAAGLLTMFIKHALVAKEITPDGYRILDPGVSLANLNEILTHQDLPNCQFVTVCYCLLNVETLELRFARGGHPHPLLIGRDGRVTEIKTQGALMGLFPGAEFSTASVQMHPGEKLIVYTDGIEVSFVPREGEAYSWEHYRNVFEDLSGQPIEEMVRQLDIRLNAETGSLNPRDDVTIVGMQISES